MSGIAPAAHNLGAANSTHVISAFLANAVVLAAQTFKIQLL